MLHKKLVVIWAKDEDALLGAAEDAVTAARESGNVQAFGIHEEDHSVPEPHSDPHWAPSVDEVLRNEDSP